LRSLSFDNFPGFRKGNVSAVSNSLYLLFHDPLSTGFVEGTVITTAIHATGWPVTLTVIAVFVGATLGTSSGVPTVKFRMSEFLTFETTHGTRDVRIYGNVNIRDLHSLRQCCASEGQNKRSGSPFVPFRVTTMRWTSWTCCDFQESPRHYSPGCLCNE